MFASLRHWVQAARPLAQVNIALPLVLGHAAAWHVSRSFDVVWLMVSLAWGVGLHLYIVLSNDVADADSDTMTRTWLSGGSGVVIEGKIDKQRLGRAARAAATCIVLITVGCILLGRPWTLVFALGAFGLLWAYQGTPRLSYRGGGEWLQGLGTGGVLPALGYYLETGGIAPWWLVVPAVIAGTAGNVVTAVPDEMADRASQKRTMPVRVGVRAAGLFTAVALLTAGALSALFSPDFPLEARLLLAGTTLVAPACLAVLDRPFTFAVTQSSVHVVWLISWTVALSTLA